MQRQPVVSSNIKSIGFDGAVLEVQFANGTVYQYAGDSAAAHHEAMLKATSVGAYFAQHVRNDRSLQTKRIEEGTSV